MRAGSIALAVGSAVVALGGLYLLIELRAGPSTAPAAAAPEPKRAAARPSPTIEREPTSAGGGKRPDRPAGGNTRLPTPWQRGDAAGPMLAKLDGDPAADKVASDQAMSVETADHLLEANKLYDRGDYDGARTLAVKLLGDAPGNVRLLRVVVSSSCIMGDGDTANQYAGQLPEPDRVQMVDRCAKFQIALK
ncbi:MAG: hypothetical protein IPL61_06645 [Myxococcales bacterium]|nr:hypothetical protein [Myxococcales bacterium]